MDGEQGQPGLIGKLIARVESGEQIDWRRERLLAELRIAELGEQFAQEMLGNERNADEAIKRIIGDGQ